MRLADYVVSYSLQINNRCLRYLAECDARGAVVAGGNDIVATEAHTVYAENLLARDSRRLLSLWSLMQPAWKQTDEALAEHVTALGDVTRSLTEASSARRLALRLANLAAEDDEAQAFLQVARKLPDEASLTWDRLNDEFARDSHFWRSSGSLGQLDDVAIQRRITRSYRKAYRRAEKIPPDDAGRWLDAEGDKLYQWVQLSAHQLELLRAGLSENGKTQLWYLDKMSDTLRTRAGLQKLQRAGADVKVKKSTARLVGRYIEQQIHKMDKRIVRLTKGCFTSKPKRMNAMTENAVSELGLDAVSLIQTTQPAGSNLQAASERGLL